MGRKNVNISIGWVRSNTLDRATKINSYKWTPTSDLTGWKAGTTYFKGKTYYGLPYTFNNPQSKISTVSTYNENYKNFDECLTSSNFYNYIYGTTPYYGNDCSGYVSMCWDTTTRLTTPNFKKDFPKAMYVYNSLDNWKKYSRLSPGDAVVFDEGGGAFGHIIFIKSISPVVNSSGNTTDLKFICLENSASGSYLSKQTTHFASSFASYNYRNNDYTTYTPITAGGLQQDYTWTWAE